MGKRSDSATDLNPAGEPAPDSDARSTASQAEEDLTSSGERAVLDWLDGVDDDPPGSATDDTLRGMKLSLDAWGRYGGATDDRTATRERRRHRLVRQYAARQYAAALATAERMLTDDSTDTDAAAFAEACRARVEAIHLEALGGPQSVFRFTCGGRILRALETDERTACLATLVQRGLPLAVLLDLHVESRLEVLLVVARLVAARVLEKC